MEAIRPYVLTLAGFDPSNGAGLTADVKTFEQHKVYGLSVCTGITLQTEDEFLNVRWENASDICLALQLLLKKYPVRVIKTGIMPSMLILDQIISCIHHHDPTIKIIIDPVFKASAGFNFYKETNKDLFFEILKKCWLITPNMSEAIQLTNQANALEGAKEMGLACHVLLKGGHSEERPGVDYLISNGTITELYPQKTNLTAKHGSGCILSAAITANIALGFALEKACKRSKNYIETILSSNHSLLAYHHVL